MATIRSGNQAALLVVDVQVAVMAPVWEAPRIIKNVGLLVEKARSQSIPVIWVQHADDELVFKSPGWQISPALSPLAGETRIDKQYNSAFEQTSLAEVLAQLDVSHIVLAGTATNWCIRATAYSALERGYDLTLVKDAHTTEAIELEDGSQIAAEHIIHELNTVMRWLNYPGRTCDTAATAAVRFAAPGNIE